MSRVFYIFILFFVGLCCETKGQTNLVYNGDFEIYSDCPIGSSSPFSLPYEIEKCAGWTAPTYGTSDYFNVCNNGINGAVGVPVNTDGFQNAYSGKGYCGFLAYSTSNGGCYSGSYWWEYIQGSFIQPLVSGHVYQIAFRFCFTEASDIAVKELGFYLSKTRIGNACSPAPLSYVPQIKATAATYFNDTSNWFLISGEYTAIGGEEYITIGNFKDSITTDTSNLYPGINANFSYYYVDAGSVYDITEENICSHEEVTLPNVFTPNADGINDVFKLAACTEVFKTIIFNRWGLKVFETDRVNYDWDGRTTAGELYPDGSYFYVIETKEKLYKGFVQLIR